MVRSKTTTNTQKHLGILGLRVVDSVTGYTGIATTVAFDLYGCIQVFINPGLDKDGKLKEGNWFDIARFEVVNNTPVMRQPDFENGAQAEGMQGAAEKTAMQFNK
jgi:hypothetical protein